MVRSGKEICTIYGNPRMRRWTSYSCDECECECDQESCDPKDWLWRTPKGQLCWGCMLDMMELQKV